MKFAWKCLFATGAAIVCTIFATASTASAQTDTLSFNDGVGTPNAGTYTPGQSFTFAINMTFAPGGNVSNLFGYSYWFEQQNPSPPFSFAITNRDFTGSDFTDAQTSSITYPQNLTPQNTSDLGALTPGATGFGAGTYFVANITFSISASATPGTYILEDTTSGGKTSIISDSNGHTFAIPQAQYTVTIVPEPSSLALITSGCALLGWAIWRRRGIAGQA